MTQLSNRIVALKPYQENILGLLQTGNQVQVSMFRWGHQMSRFWGAVAHTLQKRYHLNETFQQVYQPFLQEVLINAQRESDFAFLLNREILKSHPRFDLADGGTSQELLDSILATRRPELIPLVIEFQTTQINYYQWLEAQTQKVRVKDIPPVFRDTYPLIRERRAKREFNTVISFLLEPQLLEVTIANKSYLDETQINRLMGKMMHTHIDPDESMANSMDESHGGAGLGGKIIQRMLYSQQGFDMQASQLPFVIIPDRKNHQVTITLTLDAEALAKLKNP